MLCLKEIRKARGITARELGEKVGVSESAINLYESGKRKPDYEMLLRIGTDGIREKIKLFSKIHNDRKGLYKSFEVALSTIEILAERYRALGCEMLETADEKSSVDYHYSQRHHRRNPLRIFKLRKHLKVHKRHYYYDRDNQP